ncbi:MAG: DUF72 domain-containing protein [Thermoplasmatota archaeon]
MIRMGTSGWYYDEWSGEFYPGDLKKKRWLEFYAEHFDTVEVNASFYRLPSEKMLKSWKKRSPEDFLFVLKGSRMITHKKRLKDAGDHLSRFYNRISLLKDKTAAVLWQIPGNIERDDRLLEDFLKELDQEYDNVLEFRDESWLDEEVYDVLEQYDTSFCIVDCPDLPSVMRVTSEPAYIRFHGKENWYSHDYSARELGGWATKISELEAENTFCFFNNDQGGYAPKNCLELKRMLSG